MKTLNFKKYAILRLKLMTDIQRTVCEIALGLMSEKLTDDKLALVQAMAWCRQAIYDFAVDKWISLDKIACFDSTVIELYSWGSNCKKVSIGWDEVSISLVLSPYRITLLFRVIIFISVCSQTGHICKFNLNSYVSIDIP